MTDRSTTLDNNSTAVAVSDAGCSSEQDAEVLATETWDEENYGSTIEASKCDYMGLTGGQHDLPMDYQSDEVLELFSGLGPFAPTIAGQLQSPHKTPAHPSQVRKAKPSTVEKAKSYRTDL